MSLRLCLVRLPYGVYGVPQTLDRDTLGEIGEGVGVLRLHQLVEDGVVQTVNRLGILLVGTDYNNRQKWGELSQRRNSGAMESRYMERKKTSRADVYSPIPKDARTGTSQYHVVRP